MLWLSLLRPVGVSAGKGVSFHLGRGVYSAWSSRPFEIVADFLAARKQPILAG